MVNKCEQMVYMGIQSLFWEMLLHHAKDTGLGPK